MKFVDCHCHIADNYFFKNIEQFIEEWKASNVTKVCAMATNLKTSNRNLELVTRYPEFFTASAGRHPWGAHKFTEIEQINFEKICNNSKIKIIGEIGLDYYFVKEKEKYIKQKEVFAYFLTLANKLKKPIMLNLTGAEEDIYEALTTHKMKVNICCHWYSGSEKTLQKLIDLGCYFSINPKFLGSRNHRNVLSFIPKNRILTESDGPLKIGSDRGSPSLMPFLCEKIAEEIRVKTVDIADQIYSNFQEYLQ